MFPPKPYDMLIEGLDAFIFFFKYRVIDKEQLHSRIVENCAEAFKTSVQNSIIALYP